MARIDCASQTGCWHGSDGRSIHDIDASPPWWKHPLARLIDCVYHCDGMPSNGKNTTIRGVRWAPVMPTARPHNVGPCAARASCQKIDPTIDLHAGGEVCPGFPRADSHGHRCTRALAVRPLQPSRAWSRRLDRRHWRRRIALLRSRTVLPTIPERRRLYTLVYLYGICLGVKSTEQCASERLSELARGARPYGDASQ